jgi:hypothetical protein
MLAQTFTTTSDTAASAGVSIVVLLVELVIGVALLALHIYTLVQILKYDDAQYTAANQNRGLWLALGIIGFCCFGIVIDLIFLLAIRPKLQQATSYGYGGPPQPPQPGYPT